MKNIEPSVKRQIKKDAMAVKRDLYKSLRDAEPLSDEYYNTLKAIDALDKTFIQGSLKRPAPVEKILEVGGACLQTVMLLAFEAEGHVITSKAVPFVKKL